MKVKKKKKTAIYKTKVRNKSCKGIRQKKHENYKTEKWKKKLQTIKQYEKQ